MVKRIIVLGSEKIELGDCTVETHQVAELCPENNINLFKPCSLHEIAREAVQKAEKEAIQKALMACKWNKKKSAAFLSISYKTLFYKMKQYNLLE